MITRQHLYNRGAFAMATRLANSLFAPFHNIHPARSEGLSMTDPEGKLDQIRGVDAWKSRFLDA